MSVPLTFTTQVPKEFAEWWNKQLPEETKQSFLKQIFNSIPYAKFDVPEQTSTNLIEYVYASLADGKRDTQRGKDAEVKLITQLEQRIYKFASAFNLIVQVEDISHLRGQGDIRLTFTPMDRPFEPFVVSIECKTKAPNKALSGEEQKQWERDVASPKIHAALLISTGRYANQTKDLHLYTRGPQLLGKLAQVPIQDQGDRVLLFCGACLHYQSVGGIPTFDQAVCSGIEAYVAIVQQQIAEQRKIQGKIQKLLKVDLEKTFNIIIEQSLDLLLAIIKPKPLPPADISALCQDIRTEGQLIKDKATKKFNTKRARTALS